MLVQRVGFSRFFVRLSDALLDRVVKLEDADSTTSEPMKFWKKMENLETKRTFRQFVPVEDARSLPLLMMMLLLRPSFGYPQMPLRPGSRPRTISSCFRWYPPRTALKRGSRRLAPVSTIFSGRRSVQCPAKREA